MLAAIQDKKEHVETVSEPTKAQPSFPSDIPNISAHKDDPAHMFKYRFIKKQIQEAKLQLKEAVSPRTLLRVGDMYLLSDHYTKAIGYFLSAIDLDKNFLPAYEKIVLAYLIHKEYEHANDYYLQLIEVSKRRLDILHKYAIFKAFIFKDNLNIGEALSILQEILDKDQENFEALNTYGLILLNDNKIQEAKKYFKDSARINPNYVHATNNLGVCFLREDNFSEAEKYLLSAVDIAPSYLYSYQNLCAIYLSQNEPTRALEILTRAKHRQVRLDRAWEHKFGWLLIQVGRMEEALEWYQKKVVEEPNNDLLYNNLGVCLRAARRPEQAEQCFLKAVNLFKAQKLEVFIPDRLKSFYNLGRMAADKADADAVFEVSQDILRMQPENPFGLYLEGAHHLIRQEFSEAKEFFVRALAIERKIPEIYPDYAFILEVLEKDYEGAIKLLEEAQSYNFNTVSILNNLAFAYARGGALKKAEKILSHFDFSKDIHPVLLATKGLLEMRKNNFEKGNEYYRLSFEKFTGKSLKIAKQIWLYEKARFWFNKGEFEKAQIELDEAKQYPESYASIDLNEMQEKVNSRNNRAVNALK